MKKYAYIVFFMIGISAFFGSAVSGLFIISQNKLEQNRQLRLQKAFVEAFRLGDVQTLSSAAIAELVETQVQRGEMRQDPVTGWEFELIKAYTSPARQELAGYGFFFRGLGFWAPIEGLMTVDPDLQQTIGLVILRQQETPGLGGRIEEPVFTDQFRDGLKIEPPGQDQKYLEISATAPDAGSPRAGRHVNAITGATQTGMAMERILNEYLARFNRAMREAGKREGGKAEG